jgi:Ala-tRNA(Pro) deacylase
LPATRDELFAVLDPLGIEHSTPQHPPLFTVEEGRPWHDKIPGLHCKNLFIKGRKGGTWLVVMPADKRADLAPPICCGSFEPSDMTRRLSRSLNLRQR